MKLLAPLRRRGTDEKRYTTEDYASWLAQSMGFGSFGFQGSQYPLGVNTTMPGSKTEPIEANFLGFVSHGLKGNGIVWTCNAVRLEVFTQARFKWRRLNDGRPGKTFGTNALAPLEEPWPNATTGDLLAWMLVDADLAGNFYGARTDQGIVRLRPDWVDIILEPLTIGAGPLGSRKVGYAYWDGGARDRDPTILFPDEVCHFAPKPDPVANFRGMTWLTPVIREVMGDSSYSRHKTTFIDNAATPNLAVSLAKEVTPAQFQMFVDMMDASHKGAVNAGKTLYLGAGADVTVVGADMKSLDFKAVQGAGETRIAAASGVGAVIAQFSEGMQGSSLNAGNYAASRRRFADITMRHLWQQACGALAPMVAAPRGAELWYLANDIPFLQEDAKDAADIESVKATSLRTLVDGGFDPVSAIEAVDAQDITLLEHTGKLSVQLQEPGTTLAGSGTAGNPVEDDDDSTS
jgi:hypothetical protein